VAKENEQMAAERAFKTLFKRLSRVAIEAGVSAPVAHRLMKEALVETAEESFTLDGKRLTDSRISVLTGVHRKDIRAFRDENAAPRRDDVASKPGILSTVIGRWLADPEFAQSDGSRLSLPRHADDGPSFDALVEKITSDVRPRTLLDELLRKGVVTIDTETEMITLTHSALIGDAGLDDGLYFLERNVGDHIAAVTENMLSDPGTPPMVERAVFYNRLTSEAVDRLQSLSREKGVALLEDLNRAALALQTESREETEAHERFRFGVYFYREAVQSDPAGDAPAGAKPADEESGA
jgi:hypothetical protein